MMEHNNDELISDMLRSIDRQDDELVRQQTQLKKHSRKLQRQALELSRQSRAIREQHKDQERQYAEQSENATRLGIILNRIITKNKLRT